MLLIVLTMLCRAVWPDMLIHNDIVRSGVVMSATPERTFCVIYNQLWFMRFIAPKSAGNLLN